VAVAQQAIHPEAVDRGAAEPSDQSRAAPLRRHLLPPSDGPRYRQLTLTGGAGGDLTLTWHEMGASPEAAWGADDDEVTAHLSGEAVARLAFGLLAGQLQGRTDGLERFLALCEQNGVEPELASWT
jgi:hypothetical protein